METNQNYTDLDIKNDHIRGLKNLALRVSKIESTTALKYFIEEAYDYMDEEGIDNMVKDMKLAFLNHLTRQIEIHTHED